MKSNCCQAKMIVVGGNNSVSTRYYMCDKCNEPCDMYVKDKMKPNAFIVNCIRCDKLTSGEHTCTPTDQFRAGIVEGLKMATIHIDIQENPSDSTERFAREVMERIDELIKQYSGEYGQEEFYKLDKQMV